MTAVEFLKTQLEDAGYQLSKSVENIPEAVFDTKLFDDGFTPRETLVHLAEAYQAAITHLKGETHEWGSFSVKDKSSANVVKVWSDLRAQAVDAIVANGSDDALETGHGYLVAHDYYHVGQICAVRFTHDKSFDAMSIYRF